MKKKPIYYAILSCAALLIAGCNADDVRNVDFNVQLRNDPAEIHVGDEVVFDFSGNPDYIVFWSGVDGHRYENCDRLTVEVENLSMTYSIMHQYGRTATNDVLSILVSEDFNGAYTKEGIEAATWTKLSQTEDDSAPWWVPSSTQKPAKESSGDLSDYVEKRFVLAFRYKTPERVSGGEQHPRVDITPLSLNKTSEGKTVKVTNPETDLGFRVVCVDGSESRGNTNVSATTILFQPSNSPNPEYLDYWCISQPVDASKVSPDTGEPIRSLTIPVDSHTVKYDTSGTYTVTFVARNANAWNSAEVVREIVIEVKD